MHKVGGEILRILKENRNTLFCAWERREEKKKKEGVGGEVAAVTCESVTLLNEDGGESFCVIFSLSSFCLVFYAGLWSFS